MGRKKRVAKVINESLVTKINEVIARGGSIIDFLADEMEQQQIDGFDIVEQLPSDIIQRIKLEYANRNYRCAKATMPEINSTSIAEFFK